MFDKTRVPVRQPDLAFRLFDGEAVIIDPLVGKIYMLNPVGSRIWELVDGTRTIAEIGETLSGEFEIDVEQATESAFVFCEQLLNRNLLFWQEP
ncbi:MAG: PqqD family protein [Chloroflexi bacterium]|nr:PqqD family protein [Chloroflexota bacterium]